MAPTTEKASSEPQEADSWVEVRRRKVHPGVKKASTKKTPHAFTPGEPTISLEQMKQEYSRFSSEWLASPACAQLRELLSGHTASTGSRITKAICFGLGSFDTPVYDWKRSTHIQMAAFLAIVEHLQIEANSQIRCIFQEPVFNSVDKAFITSLGHEVVESPVGFQLVDSETMTFGIHLYKTVCTQILANCIPAIYIGTSLGAWSDTMSEPIPDYARLVKLEQLSTKVEFPNNKSDHSFSSTTIHWRRKDQAQEIPTPALNLLRDLHKMPRWLELTR
ncbi:hypothetical protein F4680DRAFT_233547 [Xylaria scruposa]|nr:hypothetical protein F4680DRAFT_233547 [Xylaria scruposa]